MEDFARRISVQTEGTNNVLVIELQPGETLIPYCCKIMERNNIPGLLRMRHQFMDGVTRLRYSIGGRISLREFMLRYHLTYPNGIRLLRNLCDALLHLNEYFLTVDMCYLDPEQIYVGDGLCVYLPCVPIARESSQSSAVRLKNFFEKLLSEYFATADCNSYDAMFKWVYRATLFDLETFYNTFLKEDKPAPAPRPAEKVPPVPVGASPRAQMPAEHGPEKPQLFQNAGVAREKPAPAKGEAGRNVPPVEQKGGLPFEIPGGGSMNMPGGNEKAKDKPEKERKGGFWPFGGRSAKNAAKAAPPPMPANGTVPGVPSGSPVPPMPAKGAVPAPPPVGPAVPPMPVKGAVPGTPPAGSAVPPVSGKGAVPGMPPVIPTVPDMTSAKQEEWTEGTILVGAMGKKPVSPAPAQPAAPAAPAYLVHHDQKIPILETPFLVGKFNTTLRLNYAIYDNNKVSRNHATFLLQDGTYFVRDNQSRNGTSVNGKPILPLQPVPLHDGDEIKLYDEVLVFHQG